MPRRTKIVATLGPATDDEDVLGRMMEAGMNVARVNFSHGSEADARRRVDAARRVAASRSQYVGVLGDLQGPKIRIGRFKENSIQLEEGDGFFLDPEFDKTAGDTEGVMIAYENLAGDVGVGDVLLLNDGQIVLRVTKLDGSRVHTQVIVGGVLSDHKGVNRQGGGLAAPALTDKDKSDIRLAAEMDVDYLAVSFVRTADDIHQTRALLREAGGEGRIVAKIERAEAIENIDAIIAATDVVMIARGDLGVEMGYAELTGLQKMLIEKTRRQNRIVITATQMMESMIINPSPTRAEVSDVANAVMDGSDAVMLSGETAVGKHPVAAIRAMSDVCSGAETYQFDRGRTNHRLDDLFAAVDEAIAMAVMYTANHLAVKAIIAMTESGSTALWMSRIRSDIPIFAFTRQEATRRRVTLYRGVYPVAFDSTSIARESLYQNAFDELLARDYVKEGDLVIVTKGDQSGVSGLTNSMRILDVHARSEPVKKL